MVGLLGVWVEIKGRVICIFITGLTPAEEGKTGGIKRLGGDAFEDETRPCGEKSAVLKPRPVFLGTSRGPKLASSPSGSRNFTTPVPPPLPLQKTRIAAGGPVA